MNNTNKNNKLVESSNQKPKWSDKYGKVVADAKTYSKFINKIKKHNKGLAKDKQISQVSAGTEALKLWMEKNSI